MLPDTRGQLTTSLPAVILPADGSTVVKENILENHMVSQMENSLEIQ